MRTVHGEEKILIPPIPDSEIESWPLPPEYRGLNREESREVLVLSFAAMLTCSRPETSTVP